VLSAEAVALLEALSPLAQTMVGGAVLGAAAWRVVRAAAGRRRAEPVSAGHRQIPLSAAALQLILDWRARVRRTEPDALLFASLVRQADLTEQCRPPVDRPCVRRPCSAARELADATAHPLLVGAQEGVPGRVIAQLMGHAKAQVMDIAGRTVRLFSVLCIDHHGAVA
jgi:hypothetical protein